MKITPELIIAAVTLIVAVITLVVSILTYCNSRKSNRRNLKANIASKEALLKEINSSLQSGLLDHSHMRLTLSERNSLAAEIEELKKLL